MSFTLEFKKDPKLDDIIYVALTYPYTYEDVNRSIHEVNAKCESGNIYFHK